ncbi:MAG: hypothetical protein CMG26_06765 [Candidatus Marinimicrobia bacterium]|nr:hypothetical protein [Candidatus Neomarinimicrobiota bacterium]|tara:strand:+ start:371 stop:787 length:417 start_codon:yes stop_codon:yes gene_type:complete
MGFEIILDNVQDILNRNYEFRKAKYKQEGNIFNIDFYDHDTGEFNADGFSEYIYLHKIMKVENHPSYFININDLENYPLISIKAKDKMELDKIYRIVNNEFYGIKTAGKKKSKSRKKKKARKKRKSKNNKSKKHSKKK